MLLDLRLDTSFDASNPVSHRIDATLVGISFLQRSELLLAEIESLAPVHALRLAGLDDNLLGVLTLSQHFLDVYVNPWYLSKKPCPLFIN